MRDIYTTYSPPYLLSVATDRISAFDVILNFRREIANGDLVILIQDTWRYHFATADVGEMPEEVTQYKAITREGNVHRLRLYHLRRLCVVM